MSLDTCLSSLAFDDADAVEIRRIARETGGELEGVQAYIRNLEQSREDLRAQLQEKGYEVGKPVQEEASSKPSDQEAAQQLDGFIKYLDQKGLADVELTPEQLRAEAAAYRAEPEIQIPADQDIFDQSRTPEEFEEWSQGIPVVEDGSARDTIAPVFRTGQPVIVRGFHASNRPDIEKFDPARRGEYTGAGSAREAFFFSGGPETANAYFDETPGNIEVVDVKWTFDPANPTEERAVSVLEDYINEAGWDDEVGLTNVLRDAGDMYDLLEAFQTMLDEGRAVSKKTTVSGKVDIDSLPEDVQSEVLQRFDEWRGVEVASRPAYPQESRYLADLAKGEVNILQSELKMVRLREEETGMDLGAGSVLGVLEYAQEKVDRFLNEPLTVYFLVDTESGRPALDRSDAHKQMGTALIREGLGGPLYESQEDAQAFLRMDARSKLRQSPDLLRNVLTPEEMDQYADAPENPTMYPALVKFENPLVHDYAGTGYREESYYSVIKRAKEEGHDGVILTNTEDGGPLDNIFAVFEPEQINFKLSAPNSGVLPEGQSTFFQEGAPQEALGRPGYELTSEDQSRVDALLEKHPDAQEHWGYLQPDEQALLTDRLVSNMVSTIEVLPSDEEMAAVAMSGRAKRGWYRRSARALVEIFGVEDAPRFAALLAALSPQTSVESNLTNAISVWGAWVAAGRPTDRASIMQILGDNVQGDKGEASILPSWTNNSLRALTMDDPATITLSGPKVDSFMLNLLGQFNEVTNDAWMANYANIPQTLFSGRPASPLPGKDAGYLAMNVQARRAAERLGWAPAEIQETIWSWAKALYEKTESQGETRTALQILRDGALLHEEIDSVPDFEQLMLQPEYRTLLENAGYADNLLQVEASVAQHLSQGPRETGSVYDGDTAQLDEAARRIDNLIAERSRLAERHEVLVNLSSSTGSIPGLDLLTNAAQSGDASAALLLQEIAGDSLRYLTSNIKSAEVSYTNATGLYDGYVEPAVGLTFSFAERDRAHVLRALKQFAFNFNQEQFHVRGAATTDTIGKVFDDGSFNTHVVRFELAEPLSRERVQEVIDASGLPGLTITDQYLEAYYVGDPSDAQAIEAFEEATVRADESLGSDGAAVRKATRRLWAYGDGYGATHGYDQIDGRFRPPARAEEVASARRVASRLAGHTLKGAPLNPGVDPDAQAQLQKQIADAFEEMRVNALDDANVRRAYAALSQEVLRQYDALPIKVELWTGKGEPYSGANMSKKMRQDILAHNRLYIFKTEPGSFGPPGESFDGHPLLEESGRTDSNGSPLLYNDLLRAVHDYYAHTITEVGFGPMGEEAAWRNHMEMTLDPWARWALTSETRGQNSWVNFREGVQDLPLKERGFAEQKADLLPLRFAMTGDPDIDATLGQLPGAEELGLEPAASDVTFEQSGSPNWKTRGDLNAPVLQTDNPGGEWLAGKQARAEREGRNEFGAPWFGEVTGWYEGNAWAPVELLASLPGLRGEQSQVRPDSIEWLTEAIQNGTELYPPFIQVDRNGEAWVNEGNHRIMVARELGLPNIPVEIRYFDGGEQAEGPLSPSSVKMYAANGQPTLFADEGDVTLEQQSQAERDQLRKRLIEITSSPEFQAWFQGSKAKDQFGRPMVMYHGTTAELEIFLSGENHPLYFVAPQHKTAQFFADYQAGFLDNDIPRIVMPLFVRVVNPFDTRKPSHVQQVLDLIEQQNPNIPIEEILEDIIESGSNWRLFENDAVLARIKELGHDGLIVNENGSANLAVFESSQLKDASGQNTEFSAESANIYEQDSSGAMGQVTFKGERKDEAGNVEREAATVIELFENHDLSTMLHETGHVFVHMLEQVAQDPDAPQRIKDNYAAMLKAVGATSAADLDVRLNGDSARAKQELLARMFEAYLREGKAPTRGLRAAFAAFRGWLLQVYRGLRRLNTEVTPEIAEVFDRMLATEQELAIAREVNAIGPEASPSITALMTEQELARYNTLTNDAEEMDEREANLLKREIELREEQDWWVAEREKIREQVEKELWQLPVYQAWRFMARGILPDGTEGVRKEVLESLRSSKLGKAQLMEYGLTQEELNNIPRSKSRIYTTGENFVDVEVMAAVLGFDTAFELVDQMRQLGAPDQVIAMEAQRRMLEKHGDPQFDGRQDQLMQEALYHETRRKVIEAELNTLATAAGQDRMGRPLIKQMVDEVFASTPIGQLLQPMKYQAASVRFAKEAERAAAAGDHVAAFAAKRKQLLNHEMFRRSLQAKTDVEKIRKRLKQAQQRKIDPKRVDPRYVEVVKALTSAYELDLSQKKFRAQMAEIETAAALALAELEKLSGQDEPVVFPAELLEFVERDEETGKVTFKMKVVHWRDMSMAELESLDQSIQNLLFLGRLESKNGRAQIAARNKELTAGIREKTNSPEPPPSGKVLSREEAEKLAGKKGFSAQHRKLDSMLRELDGFEEQGPMWSAIFLPLQNANIKRNQLITELVERFDSAFSKYSTRERWAMSANSSKRKVPGLAGEGFSHEERIMIALNAGSKSSVEALLADDRLAKNFDGTWNEDTLQATLDQLTDTDREVVHEIWALVDSLWYDQKDAAGNVIREGLATLEKRTTGVVPRKVEAQPFTSAGKVMRGGYFPLKYDKDVDRRVNREHEEEMMSKVKSGGFARAHTHNGSTIERIGSGGRPIQLNLGALTQHLDEVAQDLAFREPVRQAAQILGDSRVEQAVVDALSQQHLNNMQWLLVTIAAGHTVDSSTTPITRMLRNARLNVTSAVMAANVRVLLTQPLGLFQSIDQLNARWVLQGMAKFYLGFTMENQYKRVLAASDFMRDRSRAMTRDLDDINNSVELPSIRKQFQNIAFMPMVWIDNMSVAMPTWIGAYDKAMSGNVEGVPAGNEQAAIDFADNVVLRSQGSGGPLNQSRIQQDGEWMKAATMFGSYFNTTYNLQAEALAKVPQAQGVGGKSKASAGLLYHTMMLSIIPAVMGALLLERWPDGDDDDPWGQWLLKQTALYISGQWFFLRDLAGVAEGFDYSASPVMSIGQGAGRLIGDSIKVGNALAEGDVAEVSYSSTKNALRLAGYLSGLPMTGQLIRTFDYAYKDARGELKNPPRNSYEEAQQWLLTGDRK